MEEQKEIKENDFVVNDLLTINNFEFVNDDIVKFMKFGVLEDYKEFVGLVSGKNVKGFVCLKDDNIYKLEYLK